MSAPAVAVSPAWARSWPIWGSSAGPGSGGEVMGAAALDVLDQAVFGLLGVWQSALV
jgi:hypothetical protein